MLYWSLLFLIVAIIAGIFGFGNISEAATEIAVFLFWIFIIIFVISLITGLIRRR